MMSERLFFGHCRMEPVWNGLISPVDVSDVYELKMPAIRIKRKSSIIARQYKAEDRYIGARPGR
jgi:hypothetical protein